MNIGQRIKLIRESKNLTQQELAELCKKTQQDISRYENEKNKLGVNTLILLSEGLNCELKDLIGNIKIKEIK